MAPLRDAPSRRLPTRSPRRDHRERPVSTNQWEMRHSDALRRPQASGWYEQRRGSEHLRSVADPTPSSTGDGGRSSLTGSGHTARTDTFGDDIGATVWSQRARAELGRLGRHAQAGELTNTEARIARLVASGLTNRDVATAAFVSIKTVEADISHIYRKLGIRSRAELTAWLVDHDHTADRSGT